MTKPWTEEEEYRDLVDEFECVTRHLIEELAAVLEAHDTVGLVFPDYWLASLRRLGEAIDHSPSLIECAAVPAGYEQVLELYHDWAGYSQQLALAVWLYLEARENGHDHASLTEVFQALSAADAHNSARSICLKGLPDMSMEASLT